MNERLLVLIASLGILYGGLAVVTAYGEMHSLSDFILHVVKNK